MHHSCNDTAIQALADLAKASALSLLWKQTSDTIDQITACVKRWHEFARVNLPGHQYTVNQHYLRHIPEIIRQFGPLRGYGTRCMERAVGVFDRKIKSTQAPGVNAGNKLIAVAAQRYLDRVDGKSARCPKSSKSNVTVHLVDSYPGAPEIWGPHLLSMSIHDYPEINLMYYLRRFWGRVRHLSPANVPKLCNDITVGRRLYLRDATYDCCLPLCTKKHGTYVKLTLPVDKYAHFANVTGKDVEKTFFGEIILILSHKYAADERILCLVRIATNTELSDYGYPRGNGTFGSEGRLYVCDATCIDCAVGVLESPTVQNRFYYVYENMLQNSIDLGVTTGI